MNDLSPNMEGLKWMAVRIIAEVDDLDLRVSQKFESFVSNCITFPLERLVRFPTILNKSNNFKSNSMKRSSGRNAVIDLSTKFPRNSKGGVPVKDEDISLAFEFFQSFGNESKQVLTLSNMKLFFQALNKNISKKELMLMFAGKDSITLQEVRDLLLDNQISTIDPISEAFSVLDPTNTGFVQETKIRKIFENCFGELTTEELLVLIDESDFDKDGKLGLEDFRRLARPPDEP